MTDENYSRLKEKIASLPSGGITYKKINGRKYAYYQWREDGIQRSRRVKADELDALSEQIALRKGYQSILKEAQAGYGTHSSINNTSGSFRCIARTGRELDDFVKPVLTYKKRECYRQLHDYVYGDTCDRVYILYGLRRTGKTTLIRQIISEMDEAMRSRTAFLQIQDNKHLSDLNHDLKCLEDGGYRYVFIDEVTLLDDFIEGAALFSDIYAASGMKIVLSGTDSLGFIFTEDEELYDRCIMSHTTFIPYREFETVLGIAGIDNYIRYGGTMSRGGTYYNDDSMIFATKKSTDEYIDSAIARNIQHSLKNYQNEGHFRSLKELYDKNELTSAINRIVEDINHRFTLEVLTRDFKSNDLGISARNLRKDRQNPNDILDNIDIARVNDILKNLLEIKNKNEQSVELLDEHRVEIKEYLDLLDLTVEIETRWMTDFNRKDTRTVFSQPGIRYSQAEALIKSLIQDERFRNLSLPERNRVTERILDEIKGRMMEDIVLLETKLSRKNCEVFKLQFAVGEFDMVVFNPDEGNCELYEIKHSTERTKEQFRHLIDEKKCSEASFRYGDITGKYVIYRGAATPPANVENSTSDTCGVTYINVEEYLKKLQ